MGTEREVCGKKGAWLPRPAKLRNGVQDNMEHESTTRLLNISQSHCQSMCWCTGISQTHLKPNGVPMVSAQHPIQHKWYSYGLSRAPFQHKLSSTPPSRDPPPDQRSRIPKKHQLPNTQLDLPVTIQKTLFTRQSPFSNNNDVYLLPCSLLVPPNTNAMLVV